MAGPGLSSVGKGQKIRPEYEKGVKTHDLRLLFVLGGWIVCKATNGCSLSTLFVHDIRAFVHYYYIYKYTSSDIGHLRDTSDRLATVFPAA